MSERPIEVGDLVMVVHPHKCCGAYGGHIFTVTALIPSTYWPTDDTSWRCKACGTTGNTVIQGVLYFAEGHPDSLIATSRLRRIPPLTEPETTETDSEVTA